MRSHPLPSRGGVRGGVCNVSNALCCHSFAATSLQPTPSLPLLCSPLFAETSSPTLFADRILLILQTPPLTPPLEGRGWLRMNRSTAISLPFLFMNHSWIFMNIYVASQTKKQILVRPSRRTCLACSGRRSRCNTSPSPGSPSLTG